MKIHTAVYTSLHLCFQTFTLW